MIVISLMLSLALQSQDASRPAPTAPQSSARDANPFRPSDALLRALGGSDRTTGAANPDEAFQHLDNVPRLPSMHLRGVLKMKAHAKPAALIEVEDLGHYSVREGESFSFTLAWHQVVPTAATRLPKDGANANAQPATSPLAGQIPVVLRVERIERDGVIVEVGTLGERLVIR